MELKYAVHKLRLRYDKAYAKAHEEPYPNALVHIPYMLIMSNLVMERPNTMGLKGIDV